MEREAEQALFVPHREARDSEKRRREEGTPFSITRRLPVHCSVTTSRVGSPGIGTRLTGRSSPVATRVVRRTWAVAIDVVSVAATSATTERAE